MDTRNTFDQVGDHGRPEQVGPPISTSATEVYQRPTQQQDNPSGFSHQQWRTLRLAFEGVLLALCGYLLGVAGLPPLFGPPGGGTAEVVATDSETGVNALQSSSGDDTVDLGETLAGPETNLTADTGANSTPGAGVSVVIGRADWTTGYFQAALFKALLEELGYAVSEPGNQEHPPKDIYPLMALGQIDFWTNTWNPIHTSFLEGTLDDGTTISSVVSPIGSLLPASGLEGIVINSSVVADQQVTSLAQINDDPDLVSLFDPDGNGKANIYGCPDGWGCADVINETIQFNGWENLEQVQDDYNTMVADSIAKVEAGVPTLQYTWSPSGYLTSLRPGDNVQWLSLGGRERVLDGSITPDRDFNDAQPPALGPACTADPCWLGWVAADIGVTARDDFLAANPSARALFEEVQLKVLDVALANVKYDTGETTEEDIARHAREWMSENRGQVDAWLAAARSAR